MIREKQKIATPNEIYGKLPPQAIELEEAVIGALMLEQDSYSSICGIISLSSFYKEEHQVIFKVIQNLIGRDKRVDLLTVTQSLKDKGLLESIGGAIYLTNLTTKVVSAANIEQHARIIAEKYYKRQLIINASEVLKRVYEDDDVEDLSTLWQKSGTDMEEVFSIADSGSTIRDVLKTTVLEIEHDCKSVLSSHAPGITTGFESLNTNTGGWRQGNLIVLAGRPGLGKTSFALFFALEAAKAGYWVNIFSLEMKKEDLARIILAGESGVYRSNIRDGYLVPDDWQKMHSAIGRLEKLPIIFKDASGMSMNQIGSAIKKNRKNGRCNFAIVDYLQLVKASEKKSIRELEVSEISRSLKTIALTENIPVMALSQLNRSAEGEAPKLSHLRESGAIEQDADLVCFLHKSSESSSIIRFTVAKHRRGKNGEVDIYCNDEMTKFSETLLPEKYEPHARIECNNTPY